MPYRIIDRDELTITENVKECKCGIWQMRNKTDNRHHDFFCGSMRCENPECQRKFVWRRREIMDGVMEQYGLNRFFTLTLDPKKVNGGIYDAWDEIANMWQKMRKRINRYCMTDHGQPFVFICIVEAQKNGMPHIHGLTSNWINKMQLRKHWQECGGGRTNIQAVRRPKNAGNYMAKYMGKEEILAAAEYTLPGTRTIWRSRGLLTEKEKWDRMYVEWKKAFMLPAEWELYKGSADTLRSELDERLPEALWTLSEESHVTGKPGVPEEEASGEYEQDSCVAEAERGDKCEDTSRKEEIEYGYQKKRNEEYTQRTIPGEGRIPDHTISPDIGDSDIRGSE